MLPQRITVSGDYLQDKKIPHAVKLLQLLRLLDPSTTNTDLARKSGLHRSTVIRLRAEHGGAPPPTHPNPVAFPALLLTNPDLSIHARLLYGILQLTGGTTTRPSLGELAGMSSATVRSALHALAEAHWLRLTQEHRKAVIRFRLDNPEEARTQAALERARREIRRAPHLGECLMQQFLNRLVASNQFEENARPGFLVNPETSERLEYDRFYPPSVAFEFHGPHHDGQPSQIDQEQARKQQARDLMKEALSARHGITLVIIRKADLSLEGMRRKIGQHLPLRDADETDPIIRYLAAEVRRYNRQKQKTQGEKISAWVSGGP